jgi:hypothetical protein
MASPVLIINNQPNTIAITKSDSSKDAISTNRVLINSIPDISIVSPSSNPNATLITPNGPPTSSRSYGLAGEIRWDSNHLYICVSNNLWKKISLESF